MALSRVKYDNKLGTEFACSLGVRLGECLSPMLFSLFLNDLEETFATEGYEGLNIVTFKILMLLYPDDIVIFSKNAEELQEGLDVLVNYCNRLKLKVNVEKTKAMVFRKGGILPRNLTFYYNGQQLEIANKFRYLCVVFTAGGSFSECQNTLAGQAQKAIFQLNKYLYKFTFLSPRHKLELFDKLILPMLNDGARYGVSHKQMLLRECIYSFVRDYLGLKNNAK